ncbi:MAG: sulfatase [Bacteroidales bacterium]|nr:sulfatase [Bacteroidales bacterium]
MKRIHCISLVLLFLILTQGCVNTKNKDDLKKPNVVYVLTDQMRAQATSYNGDPNLKGRTPNLDRLAETGVNYRNAVSVCPVCTPHRAALLTGRYPTSTGMFFNDIHLPADEYTMAEIFKGAGYQTAYIGKWHLDGMGRSEFTPPERRQGFDYWKALECSHDYNELLYYTGDSDKKYYWEAYGPYAETDDAIDYIREHSDREKPFLLFLSWGTPHFPHHNAPERFQKIFREEGIIPAPNVPDEIKEKAREESVGYYAHIMALDSCIGRLQQALKEEEIYENTIFVFTSDHGEMMGAHSVRPKLKQLAYAESVRVPFLLKYPLMFGNKKIVVNSPINTPDILPTLLKLANIPVPESIEGKSMARAITNPDEFEDEAAVVMSISPFDIQENDEYRGIYTSRYTYIENLEGPWLMYDNEKDPYQMNNLLDKTEYQDLLKELDSKLSEKLNMIGDEFKPRKYYIEKWGYKLNKWGYIDYGPDAEPQGPSLNKDK